MVKTDLAANLKKAEEAGLLGGGTAWKPKEGDNRIRLVSECIEHPGSYNGKPTFKWLCFILDRADGEVKPYFMPNNVYEQIVALQLNPEFVFDEVPMPYDITLNVKNAGKLEVVYIVQGARANTPLAAAEVEKVAEVGSIREYQKTVYEKQSQQPTEQPSASMPVDRGSMTPPPDRYASVPEQFRPKPPTGA